MKTLRQAFADIDTEKNGTLPFRQMKKIMTLQLNSDDYKAFVKILVKLVTESNQSVDYREFINEVNQYKKQLSRENLDITL